MLSDMFQKSTNLVDERSGAKNRPHGTLFAGTWLSQKLTKIPPISYNLFSITVLNAVTCKNAFGY